jgi:hypothetical protein
VSSSRLIVTLALYSALAAGCAKAQARTEPLVPELTPPPAPPRVVESYPDETVAPAEPATSDGGASSSAARNTVKPPMPAPPRVETPVKPVEPPRVEPEKPASPPPALTLKPSPGTESTTAGSIRNLLGRAGKDLSRVNYASLTQDGKTQYDTARRFMEQAEEALRNGNLVFAGKLADKAATMAAVLVR